MCEIGSVPVPGRGGRCDARRDAPPSSLRPAAAAGRRRQARASPPRALDRPLALRLAAEARHTCARRGSGGGRLVTPPIAHRRAIQFGTRIANKNVSGTALLSPDIARCTISRLRSAEIRVGIAESRRSTSSSTPAQLSPPQRPHRPPPLPLRAASRASPSPSRPSAGRGAGWRQSRLRRPQRSRRSRRMRGCQRARHGVRSRHYRFLAYRVE